MLPNKKDLITGERPHKRGVMIMKFFNTKETKTKWNLKADYCHYNSTDEKWKEWWDNLPKEFDWHFRDCYLDLDLDNGKITVSPIPDKEPKTKWKNTLGKFSEIDELKKKVEELEDTQTKLVKTVEYLHKIKRNTASYTFGLE